MTFTSFGQLANSMKQFEQKIIVNSMNEAKIVGKQLSKEIRANAPKRTGALKKGIRMRKRKQGYYIKSTVPGRFPYHLWVNSSPGFVAVKAVWNNRNPTVYGVGSFNWTGKRGFFSLPAQKMKGTLAKRMGKAIMKGGLSR